jgi:excinuclease UvrABC helicase subunit UvrB
MNEWGNGYQMIESRMDRPASTQTALKQKEVERQEILAAVELFKAKGGKVTVIPSTISKEGLLGKMRAGEVDLISMADIAKRWKLPVKTLPAVMLKWPSMMYIMDGTQRVYCLEDIKRVEQQPNFRLHKSTI